MTTATKVVAYVCMVCCLARRRCSCRSWCSISSTVIVGRAAFACTGGGGGAEGGRVEGGDAEGGDAEGGGAEGGDAKGGGEGESQSSKLPVI
tara:strand:- start:233 stop:508 length:276 start_codon:yes stop_codon:yes gene_type:complete